MYSELRGKNSGKKHKKKFRTHAKIATSLARARSSHSMRRNFITCQCKWCFFCLLFSDDCCCCNFRSRRIERKFLKKLRKSIKRHFTLQWKFSEDCKERSWLHYECKKMFEYAIDTHRMVGMKMSALVRLRVYFKRWTFFFATLFNEWTYAEDSIRFSQWYLRRFGEKKKIIVVVVARLKFIMLLAQAGSTRLTRPTSVIRSSCRRTVLYFFQFFLLRDLALSSHSWHTYIQT